MPDKPPVHRPSRYDAVLRDARRERDRQRGSPSQRGYDRRWAKAAKAYLNEHPLCVMCQGEGRVTPATLVDHIIPHGGDVDRFWDDANWQPLCAMHHSRKTAKEDGGFGNERRRIAVDVC
jgi:5-methylcytosine-specific restriction protein A